MKMKLISYILLIFLSVGLLLVSPFENRESPADEKVSNKVDGKNGRGTTCYVSPTKSSCHGLTLKYHLTSAADLHYAVVERGSAKLEALDIKFASRADEKTGKSKENIKGSGTIASDRARLIEINVVGLKPNTSYDAYFVAEVSQSNGVFGRIISVNDTLTHPQPPEITNIHSYPLNGSSSSASIFFQVSSQGNFYYLILPSNTDSDEKDNHHKVTPEDIAYKNQYEKSSRQGSLTVDENYNLSKPLAVNITELAAHTKYDILLVSESKNSDGVLSNITVIEHAFSTHAIPSLIQNARCVPVDGSNTKLLLSFTIGYVDSPPKLVAKHSTALTDVLFVLLKQSSDEELFKKESMLHRSDVTNIKMANLSNITAYVGKIVVSLSESVFLDNRKLSQHPEVDYCSSDLEQANLRFCSNVSDLESNSTYDIYLATESHNSHGIFGGSLQYISNVRTHFKPPIILAVESVAKNGTTDSLLLNISLNSFGHIHFMIIQENYFQNYQYSQVRDSNSFQSYLKKPVQSVDTNKIITGSWKLNEERNSHNMTWQINESVNGLLSNSKYKFILLPEALNSNGVFGKISNGEYGASTNEHAPGVIIEQVSPKINSTSEVAFTIQMNPSKGILHYCVVSKILQHILNSTINSNSENMTYCMKKIFDDNIPSGKADIVIKNLTSNSEFGIYAYTESYLKNSVFSNRCEAVHVKTHSPPPHLDKVVITATPSITTGISMEYCVNNTGFIHYLVVKQGSHDFKKEEIRAKLMKDTTRHLHVETSGSKFKNKSSDCDTLKFERLTANTSYSVYIITETSVKGETTRVFSNLSEFNTSTHCFAPKVTKAIVFPSNASSDSINILVNVTHPGIVHYVVSDTDTKDPSIISRSTHRKSRVIRGNFSIFQSDLQIEKFNESEPIPADYRDIFSKTIEIPNLLNGTAYHISLNTETFNSSGVLGEFLAPILVFTHQNPPEIVPSSLDISPTKGKSNSISIKFRLTRFGNFHYILMLKSLGDLKFRGYDSPENASINSGSNASNNSHSNYPPKTCSFKISDINGSIIKNASFDLLGVGVVDNDTITVSRSDMFNGKNIVKEIDNLVTGAEYKLCFVTETADSNGLFYWKGPFHGCQTVSTFADHTNQSRALDYVHVSPVIGSTSSIIVTLEISKQSNYSKNDSIFVKCNRVPHLLVVKSSAGRDSFRSFSFPGNQNEGQTLANLQKGDKNVVANLIMSNVVSENSTHIILQDVVDELESNTKYSVFYTAETLHSGGVFTAINELLNSTVLNEGGHGIYVSTFERPPKIISSRGKSTYGNTTRISISIDVACMSCRTALVHILLVQKYCELPSLQYFFETLTQEINTTNSCIVSFRNVSIQMESRNFEKLDHQEDFDGLLPNTSYEAYFVTETDRGSEVRGRKFSHKTNVKTHVLPPTFDHLKVSEREGSTSELIISYMLNSPGEVHYLCGEAGKLNVTSPYDIVNKKNPFSSEKNDDRIPSDKVKHRGTLKGFSTIDHIEVETISYLSPNTQYDVFIITENPADDGVFSAKIYRFYNISTLSQAPIIISHRAIPLPASPNGINLSFKINAPGILHYLVIVSDVEGNMNNSILRSDNFLRKNGNYVGRSDNIIRQKSVVVNEENVEKLMNESITDLPYKNKNYSIYFVTETMNSGGIYGIVGSLYDIKTHGDPPNILSVKVLPTDARTDSLTISIELSDIGHVQYYVYPKGKTPLDLNGTTSNGTVNIVESAKMETGVVVGQFNITNLTQGTQYEFFFRSETFKSHGLLGPITEDPVFCRTHGAPPLILEEIDCTKSLNCKKLGREPCWSVSNTCGECMTGFDGKYGPSNEPCTYAGTDAAGESSKAAETSPISIAGIRPGNSKGATAAQVAAEAIKKSSNVDLNSTSTKPSPKITCPKHSKLSGPNKCQCDEGYTINSSGSACISQCPPNSSPNGPGKCRCDEGFVLNSEQSECIQVEGIVL